MAINGLSDTARTLTHYTRRQEAVAQNLAQVNTDAYKGLRVAGNAQGANQYPSSVLATDWRQGTLQETGGTFDLGIEGDGFLVLATPDGERLSRGGSLQLDAEGLLTDVNGFPVLAKEGPMHLFGGVIEIQKDGAIFSDGEQVGTLRLETVSDLNLLRREEGGLFGSKEKTATVPEGTAFIRQGHIEGANIDPVLSMVDMITIHRAYAANVQVLKAMDRTMGIAASQVGDV